MIRVIVSVAIVAQAILVRGVLGSRSCFRKLGLRQPLPLAMAMASLSLVRAIFLTSLTYSMAEFPPQDLGCSNSTPCDAGVCVNHACVGRPRTQPLIRSKDMIYMVHSKSQTPMMDVKTAGTRKGWPHEHMGESEGVFRPSLLDELLPCI